MPSSRFGRMAALALLASTVLPSPSSAQSVEEFYTKNNVVTILFGFAPGSGYETWARIVAQHMRKYIPGNPNVVVKAMPGAGSLVMANHLYNQAPKDGTVIGTFSRNLPSQVMIGLPNANLDPNRFLYVGSPELPVRVCAVSTDAGVNSVEDMQKKEVLMGGTGIASVPTFMPPVVNQLAGTKFKVIEGYPGGTDVALAIARGEVHGICQGYTSMLQHGGDMFKSGKLRFMFNFEEKREPMLNGAPSIFEYIKTDESKQIMRFINSSTELGRPFALPPGVPMDRVAALRTAFEKGTRDPEFLRDAEKANLEVTVTSGEDLQSKITELYKIPKALVDKANALMPAGASGG